LSEDSHNDEEEVRADMFRVLSKLAKDIHVPQQQPVLEWMAKHLFDKGKKDAKKLEHLRRACPAARTKEELRHQVSIL
jgi:hypothetical protein